MVHVGEIMRSRIGVRAGWVGLLCLTGLGSAQTSLAQPSSGEPQRTISTTTTECVRGTKSIHDLTPQLAINDFDGRSQTVLAMVYSYSQCIGESRHRWFINVAGAHVDEPGFNAESVMLGGGFELRPFSGAPHLALLPAVRLGREDFRPGPAATVMSAGLTVSNVHPLSSQRRRIDNRDILISATQLEWAVRSEHTKRDFSGPPVAGRDPDGTTFFGSIGVDTALGRSLWRGKASVAYQTLAGPRDGFVSVGLSARSVDRAYVNYGWNFAASLNAGDGGFRGVLLSVSRRFSR